MSVRRRKWTTASGEAREAWVVDYVDQHGRRLLKTFEKKKEADAFADSARAEVREGTHVGDSVSGTVAEAGAKWIASAEGAGLERATLDQYRQHLRLHIEPFIGRTRLSRMTVPVVRDFEDKLRAAGRSHKLTRYVIRSLGALLSEAQEHGSIVRNPVRELTGKRRRAKDASRESRGGKLKIGMDIPTPGEIRSILQAAQGRWRPFLLTAVFTGLRASELRAGATSIFARQNYKCASAQTVTAKSGNQKPTLASGPFPCPRCWSRHCVNGGCAARTAVSG
jgi:integrase